MRRPVTIKANGSYGRSERTLLAVDTEVERWSSHYSIAENITNASPTAVHTSGRRMSAMSKRKKAQVKPTQIDPAAAHLKPRCVREEASVRGRNFDCQASKLLLSE